MIETFLKSVMSLTPLNFIHTPSLRTSVLIFSFLPFFNFNKMFQYLPAITLQDPVTDFIYIFFTEIIYIFLLKVFLDKNSHLLYFT